MSTVAWIIIAVVFVVIIELVSKKSPGKSPGGKTAPHYTAGPYDPAGGETTGHRIEHPHVIDPDDYECSVCGARFSSDDMVCPHCGAQLTESFVNEDEFNEEEDEMEAWDEEDGIRGIQKQPSCRAAGWFLRSAGG